MKVAQTLFEGLRAVEIITDSMRLVAITQFGPRIAFFGKPDGKNLLLWKPGEYGRGDWDLRGGHRVWMTRPGADECEDTYATDNDPCDIALFGNGFCLTGAVSPSNLTRRGMTVKLLGNDSIQVDNFVINAGDMLYSGGLWALTCSLPTKGTRYAIPIGDGSCWDAFTMVSFREWGGHGVGGFNDSQIQMTDDMILVTPAGVENKRMVQAHSGIIAMSDPVNDITFAKKVDFNRTGNYPLNTNMAFYIGPDNFMVEMETMGPETTLKPGEDLIHREIWVLKDGAMPFDSAESVKKLFK